MLFANVQNIINLTGREEYNIGSIVLGLQYCRYLLTKKQRSNSVVAKARNSLTKINYWLTVKWKLFLYISYLLNYLLTKKITLFFCVVLLFLIKNEVENCRCFVR